MSVAVAKDFNLHVASTVLCTAATDWINSPGSCRLRIKDFVVGSFPGCPACANASGVEWDGTFPVFSASRYYIAAGTVLGGKAPLFSNCNVNFYSPTGQWFLQLACGSQYIWVGKKYTGADPLGTYHDDGGTSCMHTPTAIVEAYSL